MAGVVERFVQTPMGGHRKDLYGFIDILAVRDSRTVAIQATASGVSDRVKKILGLPEHEVWLGLGGHRELYVVGWRKYAKPVDRKFWRPRFVQILPGMTDEVEEPL